MLDFPRWKQLWFWFLTLVVGACALPSLFELGNVRWPSVLPNPVIHLGLDLAGGSHILLEADPGQVTRQRLETMEESVRAKMRLANAAIRIGDISTKDGKLTFMLDDPGKVDAVRELILPLTTGAGLTGARDWDIQVVDG
jgi:preprotein translocase subunit SecD